MRFISKSAAFSAGNFRNAEEGISQPTTRVIGGKTVTTVSEAYTITPSLPINFRQEGLTQRDIDAGLAYWKSFPGLPYEEDGVTPVNPVDAGRIGVWDSEEWQKEYKLSDEDRQGAERLLLESAFNGVYFFALEEEKAPKPWPSYDSTHHNKTASLAAELGLVAEALAYERENKNRTSVIEQLEAVLPTETGEFVAA